MALKIRNETPPPPRIDMSKKCYNEIVKTKIHSQNYKQEQTR